MDSSIIAPILITPCIASYLACATDRSRAPAQSSGWRSQCANCGSKLTIGELVPVLSWCYLRGKCRSCAAAISAFYPITEALSVLVAIWAITAAAGAMLWLSIGLGCSLLLLAAIDARDQLLPDIITLPLLGLGLLSSPLWSSYAIWEHLLGALAATVSLWGINFAYRQLRSRDGLGMGDVKLFAAAGAWLTVRGLPSTLLYATLSALIVLLAGAALGWHLRADQRLPFGIFLALGFWLTWLYGPLQIGD
jgi:leader peptidase (prepilin peptidase)/N-methyltransferase